MSFFMLRFSAAAAAMSVVTLPVTTSAWAANEALDDVVVTASRVAQPVSEVIGSVTVITRDEIEKRQVQSLQDLLRGEAGIDIANAGGLGKASSIHLRGANSSQTLILIDGVRLGSATLGLTSIEFIPVDQIERIEIVRGPRSSLYGSDAIGGVIQIFTRRNQGVVASASYGSYNTEQYSAGFGMQASSLRLNVNGAYQQSDGFDSLGTYTDFNCFCTVTEHDNDGYRNTSVSAKLGYAFGKVADLELSTLYAQGLTEFDGGLNQTRFRNSAPSAKVRITPIDALSITLGGGITQDISEYYKNNVYSIRFNTEKQNASMQIDWQIGQQQLSFGADYLNDIVDSDSAFINTERDNTGIFAQYLGKLGKHELSASARQDDNEQFGSHSTGNLGWKWFALDRALALNAGWGRAFHAPSFNDLYYPTDAFGSVGNPNLKPERSRSFEFGASGTYSWLFWSAQAFETKTQDLIDWSCDFVTFICSPNNVSRSRIQGLELTASGHWANLSAAISYTAQDPRSRAAGSNYDHLLAHRSRQSGNVDVRYQLGVAQIGARLNAVGPRYDDLANTQRLAGYTTLDLLSDVRLSDAFSLQLKLGNFFDRQYETVRRYNQEGRSVYVTLRYQPK